MTNKLYVGNLAFNATVEEIRELFSAHGAVTDVHMVTDRETRRPRGFAFITMETPEQASAAAQKLNGNNFQGRPLVVNEARPREGGPGGGGGSGADGGHRPRREFSGPPAAGGAPEREGGGPNRGYRGGGGGSSGGQRRWNDAPRPNRDRPKERQKIREPYERERVPRPHELGDAPEAEEI